MAQRDTWIVGDDFLKSHYNTLMTLANQGERIRGINKPFIKEYFNVEPFWRTRLDGMKSPIRRIINSLIDVINAAPQKGLPQMIMFISRCGYFEKSSLFSVWCQ